MVDTAHVSTIINSLPYYIRPLPEVESFVLGRVDSMEELGISVYLVEYQKHAFLNYKDASHAKKRKQIEKELQVGKEYIFIVESIDSEKAYINLNRTYVSKEEHIAEMQRIMRYRNLFNLFINTYVNSGPATLSSSSLTAFLGDTLYPYTESVAGVNELLRVCSHWYDYEVAFNTLIDSMRWNPTALKTAIREHYRIPTITVEAKAVLTSTAIDAVSDLKAALLYLQSVLKPDELFIESPPTYSLFWHNVRNRESLITTVSTVPITLPSTHTTYSLEFVA